MTRLRGPALRLGAGLALAAALSSCGVAPERDPQPLDAPAASPPPPASPGTAPSTPPAR